MAIEPDDSITGSLRSWAWRQGVLLARMGCDVLQGFACALPVTPGALEICLRTLALHDGRSRQRG